ncbi:helix-turn-helix domain containing protein [Streptacidiphilus sp. P02-A3a]|uniref:helix-turn-helix domain-containing protein n=1 Tax=Streptacidiphilus sp. P02-A3a TaxID=2704468 RepID=UPI0015F86179|nr:helix-turn-helix domain containing protein [Streptacidiphilus sp. P02-A3a]QMU68355.1 helix-turn-helix domain containing protein [Streptacidiphilus sp. P02-A3a]
MTPTRSTTWSAARQRQALDLSARYLNGASVPELARASGLSKGTVLNRLHAVDTPMRTPQQTRLLQADPKEAAARQQLADAMGRWYESGTSVPALAAVFECSQRTVRRRLVQAGTALRAPGQTRVLGTDGQARRKLMRSLRDRYEAGTSVPLLAAGCGYSTSTVYRLLHQAGTTMRPRSQPNPGTAGDRSP